MALPVRQRPGRIEKFAHAVTAGVGSSWAFLIALVLTVSWLVSGFFFHYSDTWQLVMNTISSIVTFLMVFLLQRSQNKDSLALQIKLDEIIAAQRGASNRMIAVEDLSEEQVKKLHDRYQNLAKQAEHRKDIHASLSVDKGTGPKD